LEGAFQRVLECFPLSAEAWKLAQWLQKAEREAVIAGIKEKGNKVDIIARIDQILAGYDAVTGWLGEFLLLSRLIAEARVPIEEFKTQLADAAPVLGKYGEEHIFDGVETQYGKLQGYHSEAKREHEGTETPGMVVGPRKMLENHYGIYRALVEIYGIKKSEHRGYSTFFPRKWNRQKVVDAIMTAAKNREQTSNYGVYIGKYNGMEILLRIDTERNEIITAYPNKY
jgi:hypothetical protein